MTVYRPLRFAAQTFSRLLFRGPSVQLPLQFYRSLLLRFRPFPVCCSACPLFSYPCSSVVLCSFGSACLPRRTRSANRLVIERRFLVGTLDFHDYRTQTVVARTDGDAFFGDPVPVIELPGSVRQGEYVLIDGFPRLVAKSFGLGVIGLKHLPFAHHGAFRKSRSCIFAGKVFVERRFQDGDLTAFHGVIFCGSFRWRSLRGVFAIRTCGRGTSRRRGSRATWPHAPCPRAPW